MIVYFKEINIMNYKMLKFPLVLLCPFLMINCGGRSYKVTIPDTNGVMISPNTAKSGEDYVGTISIAKDLTDSVLPDALTKVTSGNKELLVGDGYTYEVKSDHLSADFKIPGANVVGDISIQLDLVDDKINSQEELVSVLKFEDVKYVQNSGVIQQQSGIEEYSPSVYHSEIKDGKYKGNFYIERTNNETYWKYIKTNDVWTKIMTTAEAWRGVENLYTSYHFDSLVKEVGYIGFEYKDGEYYSNVKGIAKIHLKFMNKKLTAYKTEQFDDDEGEWIVTQDANFTYNEYTPDLPDVPEPPINR